MTHSSCLIDDTFKMKHCKLTEFEKKEIEMERKWERELEMKKRSTFGTHKSAEDHNESDWNLLEWDEPPSSILKLENHQSDVMNLKTSVTKMQNDIVPSP